MITKILLFAIIATAFGRIPLESTLEKRMSFDPKCIGRYDPETFKSAYAICFQCYNLYRDVAVLENCRSKCYTSETFESCLRDLAYDDDIDKFRNNIKFISGRG